MDRDVKQRERVRKYVKDAAPGPVTAGIVGATLIHGLDDGLYGENSTKVSKHLADVLDVFEELLADNPDMNGPRDLLHTIACMLWALQPPSFWDTSEDTTRSTSESGSTVSSP